MSYQSSIHPKTIIVFLLLLCIFFHDVIFLGKSLSTSSFLPGSTPSGPYNMKVDAKQKIFSFDITGNAWINEPNPYIIQNIYKQGSLPLWNPYEGLGMPHAGNLNTELFHPLKIPLNILPSPLLQDIFFLLRLFLVGVFTYFFLKEIGLSDIAAVLGGVFFMLSGFSVLWINLHPLSSVMYIPMIFYCYERWLSKREVLFLLLSAVALSLSLIGGKIPDVIMGMALLLVYASYKGIKRNGFSGLLSSFSGVFFISFVAICITAVAILPFIELYTHASPLAKSIRSGASGHSIPFITSVSLWEPLFLGGKDFFHSSWLKWNPQIALPYCGIVILFFVVYALFSKGIILATCPFILFSTFLLCQIYGFIPASLTSSLPILSSMNFLKYNAMLYFSLAVISAFSLDEIIERQDRGKICKVVIVVLIILFLYYLKLSEIATYDIKNSLNRLLVIIIFVAIIFLCFCYFVRSKKILAHTIVLLMIIELYIYMPHEHPKRAHSIYSMPPYSEIFKDKKPFRIIGDGSSIPPLVSNAMGFYDARAINVLLTHDYYIFFQNMISFSIPYTNNPNPILALLSPWSDLLNIKYILSTTLLNTDRESIKSAVTRNIHSIRWINFFETLKIHRIQGVCFYKNSKINNEEKFSFVFNPPFKFISKAKITRPYLLGSFAGEEIENTTDVRIIINEKEKVKITVENNKWINFEIDMSEYMGEIVTISIESDSKKGGNIILGDFGFSEGAKKEGYLIDTMISYYSKERDNILFRGYYNGLYIYENVNHLHRVYMAENVKYVKNMREVLDYLQNGTNFRQTALIVESADKRGSLGTLFEHLKISKAVLNNHLEIVEYKPDKIVVSVESNGGLLVLSDLYYPGWEVSVNSQKEKILNVFGLLRGVFVPAGKCEVIFSYKPNSFYIGLLISSLTVLIILLMIFKIRKKRDINHA